MFMREHRVFHAERHVRHQQNRYSLWIAQSDAMMREWPSSTFTRKVSVQALSAMSRITTHTSKLASGNNVTSEVLKQQQQKIQADKKTSK
jgi:hypothetical protein